MAFTPVFSIFLGTLSLATMGHCFSVSCSDTPSRSVLANPSLTFPPTYDPKVSTICFTKVCHISDPIPNYGSCVTHENRDVFMSFWNDTAFL